jgi:ureidoacrylate peracid hydrolase
VHKIDLRPELIEQLTRERGGRLHIFDDLDPARTAHVIVDLQNGFMEPEEVIEALQRSKEKARSAA